MTGACLTATTAADLRKSAASRGWGGGGRRRICAAFAALLVVAAPAVPSARAGDPAAFKGWIEGDWIDPRVHRCGIVHVRIRIDDHVLRHTTITYGKASPGMFAEIVALEPDGSARLFNPTLGRNQRVRYVTRNAHVLEGLDGAGGVTFVRCEGEHGTGS